MPSFTERHDRLHVAPRSITLLRRAWCHRGGSASQIFFLFYEKIIETDKSSQSRVYHSSRLVLLRFKVLALHIMVLIFELRTTERQKNPFSQKMFLLFGSCERFQMQHCRSSPTRDITLVRMACWQVTPGQSHKYRPAFHPGGGWGSLTV